MLFAFDEGFRIKPGQFTKLAEEICRRKQPDRRLQVRPLQFFTQLATKFAIHADIHICIGQLRDIFHMATQREDQVHLAADALDQAPDFGQVGRHVEGAVDRPDDVDARRRPELRVARAHLAPAGTELRPQPHDGAVGGLPLVLIDRAADEALQVAALRRHAAADHLRDGSRDNDSGKVRVLRRGGATHGILGTVLRERILVEPRDDNRQFMRRQRVRVVQHRRHWQVLATDGTVDDHPQSAHGREGVDRAPIAAGPVVIEDEHAQVPTASSDLAFARRSLRCRSRKPGGSTGLFLKP